MSGASDFGRDYGLIHEAVVTGRKAGWGAEEWAKLAHNEELMRGFLAVLNGTAKIVPHDLLATTSPTAIVAANPDLLVVDCSKPLQELIALGHYDWVDNNITPKRFPITGNGIEEWEWNEFHFDQEISSESAKGLIESAGWVVAEIKHLLAFGAKFPEKQRQYPIVALGSVAEVDGDSYVPCLYRGEAKRDLYLDGHVSRWSRCCRFLAVRKKVSVPET